MLFLTVLSLFGTPVIDTVCLVCDVFVLAYLVNEGYQELSMKASLDIAHVADKKSFLLPVLFIVAAFLSYAFVVTFFKRVKVRPKSYVYF